MRWKYEPKDWRIVTRFAWLPVVTTLPSKQYVWLELYKVNQQLLNGYWCDIQIAPWEYWSSNE